MAVSNEIIEPVGDPMNDLCVDRAMSAAVLRSELVTHIANEHTFKP